MTTRHSQRILLTALCIASAAGCRTPAAAPATGQAPVGRPRVQPTTQPVSLPATPVPAGESRLVNRPDEIISVLDNGMTVIAKRYAAAPIASVRMHVRAGSIWEGRYAGAGISHLFEHLLHGGTTRQRTEQESRELLERIAARSNAFTSFDQTVYYIDVPREHTATAIDLLADWITRPTFPPAELERELGVVQRELERGVQDPRRQLWCKANEVRYRVHPARFPVIGKKAALVQLTREDILAYYRAMYVPERVVLAVVGDIQPEAALAAVRKHFADFTARADRPIPLPDEPPVAAPRTLVHSTDVAQVRFWIGFPTVDLLDDDLYPLDVMMYVLAAGESSRLRVELRDRRKLALSIDAGSWTPAWGDGSFYIRGMCLPANWSALRRAILAEFARLVEKGIDSETLARAKRQALVEHIRRQQTASAIASSLAYGQLLLGDAHFDDQYVRRLGKVTAEQVQATARKYFDPQKLLTALVVPRDFRLPAPDAATVLGDASAVAAKRIEVTPVRKIMLDNGLTVLLRRNTAVPLVAVRMHLGGGLLAEPPEENGLCQLMARAALRGTPTRSAEQIFSAFERAGGTLTSDSGRNSFSFSASVLSEQLPEVLPVFADVVINPAFPADEVDKLKGLTLAAIDRVDDQLGATARRFFFAKFFGDFPYGRPVIGRRKTVAALTRKDLADFHRRWVRGPNAVLAVFGDIDPDRTEKLVRRLLGKGRLPAGTGPGRWPSPPAPPRRDRYFVHEVKMKQAAEVDMGFAGARYTDDDYYPLMLLDTMISGYHLPGGWLHDTLRGRQLVYVVHAINIAWRQGGVFYIYAQCPPAKVTQTIDAINEQLARARAGEFAPQQLVNAKGQVLAAELMDLQTNDRLASRCALDELLGRGYDHYLRLSGRINAVTMEDVVRVAKKYLANAVTTATTGDPAAAAEK